MSSFDNNTIVTNVYTSPLDNNSIFTHVQMSPLDNNSTVTNVHVSSLANNNSVVNVQLELYSVVLSVTTLSVNMVFGGGSCVAILLAMCGQKLVKQFRYILVLLLLLICCVFDLLWCPLEISRLLLHHQCATDLKKPGCYALSLKYADYGIFILLLGGLASVIILISFQNFRKLSQYYNSVAKLWLGVLVIFLWLAVNLGWTTAYVLVALTCEENNSYHMLSKEAIVFKSTLQVFFMAVLLIPLILMLVVQIRSSKDRGKECNEEESECSHLPVSDNFTVPTLHINEEDEEDDAAEFSSGAGSPGDRPPSALSAKADIIHTNPHTSNTEDDNSVPGLPSYQSTKPSLNHLGVNASAILSRRRHTIAQISEPHLDLVQRAKQYKYVRKFSVDITALQAQLMNPKMQAGCPFRSDTHLQKSSEMVNLHERIHQSDSGADQRSSSDDVEIQDSVSLALHAPSIVLSESDRKTETEEIKHYTSFHVCKMSCMLVATFILCNLPMLITEAMYNQVSSTAYINIVTCTEALSVVQTIIYPQIIFCMDDSLNKLVHFCFLRTRSGLARLFYHQEEIPTTDGVSDTEV